MGRQDQIRAEADVGTTSPTLLDRVREWQDDPAWATFLARYEPLLRSWCGLFSLDADVSDELCQRIWVELMARMRTFRYDPRKGFRNWLWTLFRSRAIDVLRQRRTSPVSSLDDFRFEEWGLVQQEGGSTDDGSEDEGTSAPSILLRQAVEAQEAVRSRVDPDTWRAYWMIAIEDQPVRAAANSLGKAYAAVYNGYKRVDRMLRLEGERRLADLISATPGVAEAD
jgi:RNA polymerase sigma factor (sigma-70 family)